MKRRGRLAQLLPLSVLLIIATTIYASPTSHRPDVKTTEVEHETTSTTAKTTWKSVPTVSITNTRPSNQPEVTSTAAPVKASFEQPEDNTKELLNLKENRLQEILKLDKEIPSEELSRLTKPIINPKDALLQEIRTLDENESNNQKIQEEVAKVIKAEAQRTRPKQRINTSTTPPAISTSDSYASSTPVSSSTESRAMKELLEAETDITYNDDIEGDDDDDDEEDSEEDDDDEDDDYNDDDDDVDDEEDVMTNCPDYCRCGGQYAAATTARCSKLVDKQSFGPGIAHLLIENAGEIRLGPHALRARDLEHLETITIVDTRLPEIDRTAFDGITYLFAVNLSRTNLFNIHPQTFQNNTQLNLLTIAGNPLGVIDAWETEYLLDAPSVTEFDFSWNGRRSLPKAAFSKMPNLAYLNLKQNRLTSVEKAMFKPLSYLVELDLSANSLESLPFDVFEGTDLQSLKLATNKLTTLQTVSAASLNILDVSNNHIKVIAKSDLDNVPSLEQLLVSGNEMKRIHQHAFSELDQLEILDISNNKLTSLTDHHFRNNPRLEVLLMSDNPELGSLPVFKTNGLEHNTYSTYRLECANCGLQFIKSGTFNAMPALSHLNLARNRLTGLPKGLLEPLSSLVELDLSENMIFAIPPHMLYGATSLTKLNLAGNPLVKLQVTPFLQAPELSRLNADRCQLKRVWSEARQKLKSLRFLSVRGNELDRITVEELKAMPKLAGLDISRNPLNCDTEFSEAIQWLVSHGVTPTESPKLMELRANSNDDVESFTNWTDLYKLTCEDEELETKFRTELKSEEKKPKDLLHIEIDDERNGEVSKDDLEAVIESKIETVNNDDINNRLGDAWRDGDKIIEYEDYTNEQARMTYHSWYSTAMWSVLTFGFVSLGVLLIIIQLGRFMASRRGHGPVIRPPLILRQGLVDNKNCGLVYKPLQEEIPTPQMPKKGSGYSRGPFHYKQIVPESS